MPEIRAAVRTGDTLMQERQRNAQAASAYSGDHAGISLHPAHGAEEPRAFLRDVNTVIVDEIHAVADDKRGAHLTLSLERLDALTGKSRRAHRPFRHAEADRNRRAFSYRQ